jgi:hypothetical protein
VPNPYLPSQRIVQEIEKAITDRSSTMTGSEKAYSAPKLESLSLRATSDIDIGIGISIPFPPIGS